MFVPVSRDAAATSMRAKSRVAAMDMDMDMDMDMATTQRRQQRWSREVVIEEDAEEDDTADGAKRDIKLAVDAADRQAIAVPRSSGKTDELAAPIAVVVAACATSNATSEQSVTATAMPIQAMYLRQIVREHLTKRFPARVLRAYAMEQSESEEVALDPASIDAFHAKMVGHRQSNPEADNQTRLEQLVAAWSRHSEPKTTSKVKPVEAAASTSSNHAATTRANAKVASAGSRRKPKLTVVTSDDSTLGPGAPCAATADGGSASSTSEVDFNRLNRPGHTPKAHDDMMAALIGEPGSTPMATASELKALGFNDLDDETPHATTPTSIATAVPVVTIDSSDSSQYAQKKRVTSKPSKRVNLGEPGSTPTKEYVFFREAPPQFVTESLEDAEQVLRDLHIEPPSVFRPPPVVLDRFVELQSSEVSKYSVGQTVNELGAQRNISGLISKIYGSRQCGTAGPGTIVIDVWNGSDTPPQLDPELEFTAQRDDQSSDEITLQSLATLDIDIGGREQEDAPETMVTES